LARSGCPLVHYHTCDLASKKDPNTTVSDHGDDSAFLVPSVFMFVPGMPVIVNQNTHQGLKLVNGASYTALDVILDKAHPGHRINGDTLLHFGPPAGILLAGETTRGFRFVGMPPDTMSTKIEFQKKRPWQKHNVTRRGLPCTVAFACTDYKVQKQDVGTSGAGVARAQGDEHRWSGGS
jgi:hypothetical protein